MFAAQHNNNSNSSLIPKLESYCRSKLSTFIAAVYELWIIFLQFQLFDHIFCSIKLHKHPNRPYSLLTEFDSYAMRFSEEILENRTHRADWIQYRIRCHVIMPIPLMFDENMHVNFGNTIIDRMFPAWHTEISKYIHSAVHAIASRFCFTLRRCTMLRNQSCMICLEIST